MLKCQYKENINILVGTYQVSGLIALKKNTKICVYV
jgi:hypothetical protein